MKNILCILISSLILFSCNNNEQKTCTPSKCLGPQTLYLGATNKKLVITKDTTYLFKDAGTDTIRVKYKKFVSDFYNDTETCDCEGPNTETTGERDKSFYVFVNRDLACWYEAGAVNGSKVGFDIVFGDTSYVLYNMNSNLNFSSQFLVNDMNTKVNNFDSLTINGKKYYNIISSYDYQSNASTGYVTQCYYARHFGIVRFKLNGVFYDILN